MVEKTEIDLKELRERFNLVLDVAEEGFWEWNIEKGTVLHNKKWCEIFEVDESYLSHPIGDFIDFIHPEDRERVGEKIEKAIMQKSSYYSEHRMQLDSGRIIWVVDRGVCTKDSSSGKFIMVGSITDITSKKQSQLDLIEEKEILQSTLTSVGDAVISTDMNRKITIFNPVAEKLTGWKREEALGRDVIDIIKVIDNKTKEEIDLIKSFEICVKFQEECDGNRSLLTRSGRLVNIIKSISQIKLPHGESIGYVIVIRDITGIIKRQEKIEYLSYRDELTGLYNRRYMNDSLTRLDTSRNLPFTIMMIDVNNLKIANDVFGHEKGDQLIIKVAKILKEVFREDDVVSRLGGDEFCILLPNTSLEDAEKIRRRIRHAEKNHQMEELYISLAIGYATKTNTNESIDKVFKAADQNMYKNKFKYKQYINKKIIDNYLANNYEKFKPEKEHDDRVGVLAAALYQALGKSEDEVKRFKNTAQLHDIGKIVIPGEILNKKEALTKEEVKILQSHSLVGYQILSSFSQYSYHAEDILYHHERMDGGGYPQGLRANKIPLGARVIAVADAYESMTAERPYKNGKKSKGQAIEELRRKSGTQFDPELVELFIEKVLSNN